MGFSFHFSSLYPAPYIELYVSFPIWISYFNFRAVLVLPKTVGSAQTHKSMSVIWIVWSTLYVYLCLTAQFVFLISVTPAVDKILWLKNPLILNFSTLMKGWSHFGFVWADKLKNSSNYFDLYWTFLQDLLTYFWSYIYAYKSGWLLNMHSGIFSKKNSQ